MLKSWKSKKTLVKKYDFSLKAPDRNGPDIEKILAIYSSVVGTKGERENLDQFIEVHQDFCKYVGPKIKKQYLSHFRVALEHLLQDKLKNPFFRIILHGREGSDVKDLRAQVRFHKESYALIRYNAQMNEKQLRVILAHEMGHIFQYYLNKIGHDHGKAEAQTEPMATFIGVLAIINKNYFYTNESKKYRHQNIKDILADFDFLKPKFNNGGGSLSS